MRKIFIVIIIAVILFAGVSLWWKNGLSAVSSRDISQKVFVIPKGTSVRAIGNELKKEGLIKDPVVFFIYIRQNKLDQNIQAGSYKLSASMDLPKIMETIRVGTVDTWVTIPEGLRSEEIAEILEREIPTFDSSWVATLKSEEGYLFPDTYLIPKDASISTVISIFKNNFYSKIKDIGMTDNDAKLNEIVILASLIEREALRDDEKPMIASVLYNRLNEGMALDIDATLQYAKGKSSKGKWWVVPMGVDRQIDSPYNTYKYPGIPPGPIANPGIEAIRAAKSPASSDYFFYIHDNGGNVHFSKNLEGHNQNIEKYLN